MDEELRISFRSEGLSSSEPLDNCIWFKISQYLPTNYLALVNSHLYALYDKYWYKCNLETKYTNIDLSMRSDYLELTRRSLLQGYVCKTIDNKFTQFNFIAIKSARLFIRCNISNDMIFLDFQNNLFVYNGMNNTVTLYDSHVIDIGQNCYIKEKEFYFIDHNIEKVVIAETTGKFVKTLTGIYIYASSIEHEKSSIYRWYMSTGITKTDYELPIKNIVCNNISPLGHNILFENNTLICYDNNYNEIVRKEHVTNLYDSIISIDNQDYSYEIVKIKQNMIRLTPIPKYIGKIKDSVKVNIHYILTNKGIWIQDYKHECKLLTKNNNIHSLTSFASDNFGICWINNNK